MSSWEQSETDQEILCSCRTGSHELAVAYVCESLCCSLKGAEGSVSVYIFKDLKALAEEHSVDSRSSCSS